MMSSRSSSKTLVIRFHVVVILRQGENVPPILFALMFNEMETFFSVKKWNTLKCVDKLYNDSNDGINGLFNMLFPLCR